MAKNLLRMLFIESQVDEELAALVEEVADIDMGDEATIKVDKAPLAKIVSALGIEGGTLEADPRGLSMSFDDGDLFRAAHAILNEPDSMHKLATAGWVYSLQGDIAQANEPADFRIRFLEIDDIEPENMKASADAGIETRNNKIKDILKKGREFATAKPEHDDDMNPVEFDDKGSDDRGKGVGKEKDGAQPEGKPKGSTKESLAAGLVAGLVGGAAVAAGKDAYKKWKSKKSAKPEDGKSPKGTPKGASESLDEAWKCQSCGSPDYYVRGGIWKCSGCDKEIGAKMPKDESLVGEGGHKAGCTCGFCKNKGSFGKKPKETDEGPDDGETTDGEFKIESLSPEAIVNAMLEGNPGTQPGILGTKSFSSTKVPDEHKDRPFSPAPGMVQPDNEIVNKQAKRKVNDGK